VSEARVVTATDETLETILDESFGIWGDGLTRAAYGRFNAAQLRTPWGRTHLRRLALVDGGRLLSSAKRYDLAGRLDGRRVRILGIGAVFTPRAERGRGHAPALIRRMIQEAADEGVELALLFSEIGAPYYEQLGFRTVPTGDLLLQIGTKAGAPAMLVRAGEERDYAEIGDMHAVRAARYRFALERDAGYLGYAIAKKRMLAGFGARGHRALQFFVAEEGGRAVAYLVMTVTDGESPAARPQGDPFPAGRRRTADKWTIEDCGDRDPTGARLGAMLQVLLARMPGEQRPTIRAWLPAGFRPPQMTGALAVPCGIEMMMRWTGERADPFVLKGEDVLYWRGDAF